jgi:serine/threonine-protein kinase
VPPELEQVVLWALNKDPAYRPADADDLIAALENARASIMAGSGGQRTADIAALPVGAAAAGGLAAGVASTPDAAPAYVTGAHEALPEQPIANGGPGPGDDGGDRRRDRRRRWPWIVVVLLLLAAGGGVAAYLLTRPVKKVVPTVVGENLNIARTQLQNDGFGLSIIQVPDTHPAGIVIAQAPTAGSKANDGSTVSLTVSQGPGNVNVPSVSGLSEAQARQQITKAQLKVGRVETQTSDQVTAGNAIGTDPSSGQSLPIGTAVTLIVSSGQAKVTVPDVTGQSQAAATSSLSGRGFSVSSSTQESSSVPVGNVISQSPAPGTKVTSGSTVSLVIAKAPATPTVPSVTGKTASAATSALKAAGFKVSTSNQEVTKKNQSGKVVSQSPSGGSQAKKGSTVSIVVGHFTPPTPTTPTTTTTTPTTP